MLLARARFSVRFLFFKKAESSHFKENDKKFQMSASIKWTFFMLFAIIFKLENDLF